MSKVFAALFLVFALIATSSAIVPPRTTIIESQGGLECYGCELFVTSIDNYIKSNKSISGLEQYAIEACQFLGSFKDVCEDEVPQLVPLVVDYLENELSPEEICSKIGVCTNSSLISDEDDECQYISMYCFDVEDDEQFEEEDEVSTCDICESVFSFVDDYISLNATQTKLESMISNECNKFFPNHEQSCNSFSNFLVPKVTEFLESTNVCEDIGVCS